MDSEQMETMIDELREQRDAYYELVRDIKQKIQDEYDMMCFESNLLAMSALRRLIFFIEASEVELVE